MGAARQTVALSPPAAPRFVFAIALGLLLACIGLLFMRGLGLGGIGLGRGGRPRVVDAGAADGGTD